MANSRFAVIAAMVMALAASGCTKTHHPASAQTTQDEAKAQALVQACAAKANFLSAGGRKAFYACVAPPGESAAVQSCATKALAKDGVLTRAARQRFKGDVAVCILPAPKSATPKPSVTRSKK